MNMTRFVFSLFLLAISPCHPQFLDALLAQMGALTPQPPAGNGGRLEGPCIPPTTTTLPTTTPAPTTTTTTTTQPTTTSSTTPSPSQVLINIFSRLPFFIQRRLIDGLAQAPTTGQPTDQINAQTEQEGFQLSQQQQQQQLQPQLPPQEQQQIPNSTQPEQQQQQQQQQPQQEQQQQESIGATNVDKMINNLFQTKSSITQSDTTAQSVPVVFGQRPRVALGNRLRVAPIQPVRQIIADPRRRLLIDPRYLQMVRTSPRRRRPIVPGGLRNRFPTGRRVFSRRFLLTPGYRPRQPVVVAVPQANLAPTTAAPTTTPTTTTPLTTTATTTTAAPVYDMYDPFFMGGFLLDGTHGSSANSNKPRPRVNIPRRRRKRQGWGMGFGLGLQPIDLSMCTCQPRTEVIADAEYTIHPTLTCAYPDLSCACTANV